MKPIFGIERAILRWFVSVCACLLLGACANKEPFRTVNGVCAIAKAPPATAQAYDWEAGAGGARPCEKSWQVEVTKPVPFSVNFVEVDEQGVLADRAQAESALAAAGKEEAEGSYVVVFVHGWHHNAGSQDANVNGFYSALAAVSRWNPNRKVKGIYIGWRGDSLAVPLLRYATFWDRKSTSDEVGRGGLLEFLLRLERAAKPDEHSRNRLVVIGHSFGASVAFNALAHVYMERFIDGVYSTAEKSRFRGYGDLVVLINPAIEAMRYMPFQSALEYYTRDGANPKADFAYEAEPRLVILSSQTDKATRIAFPAARFFSTFLESHNSISMERSPHEHGAYSEWNMDRDTVGNFERFHSHFPVGLARRPQESTDDHKPMDDGLGQRCRSLSPADVRARLSVVGKPSESDREIEPFPDSRVLIRRRTPSQVGSPYIIADVRADIVDGHTDIGGPHLLCWINQLLDTREATVRPLQADEEVEVPTPFAAANEP